MFPLGLLADLTQSKHLDAESGPLLAFAHFPASLPDFCVGLHGEGGSFRFVSAFGCFRVAIRLLHRMDWHPGQHSCISKIYSPLFRSLPSSCFTFYVPCFQLQNVTLNSVESVPFFFLLIFVFRGNIFFFFF